jgi:hypothetical protein
MSVSNFLIVAANTAPDYQITCTRSGTDIDLTTASAVNVLIYNKSSKAQTNTGHTTATITTPASGLITYRAQAADFPSRGKYVADISVTWTTGTEILYSQASWKVRNAGA